MNDLCNVRDVLYSFSNCVKEEYQDLYVSIVAMIDSYVDKNTDTLNLSQSKEQIYKNYRAVIDEYNTLQEKYNDLQEYNQQLQDLFYRIDIEHDELKVKYDECQKNYHAVVRELRQSLK